MLTVSSTVRTSGWSKASQARRSHNSTQKRIAVENARRARVALLVDWVVRSSPISYIWSVKCLPRVVMLTIALGFLPSFVVQAGIVISEFRTRGPNGAADEFIELYNNSSSVVDVSGWKINGSNSSGATSTRLTI